jgi:hypothetical protein
MRIAVLDRESPRPWEVGEDGWIVIADSRPPMRLLSGSVELDEFDPDLTPARVVVRSTEDVEVI